MNWSVHNNMLAMYANSQMKIGKGKKAKTTEKLSSGYRINRAADDAANLAISEKMRFLIRGLNQGTENAQDGVSWVQIGDGCLNEVHDILHRMEELTIKSLNETNTADDRAYMQKEFDQLQSEIDRITKTTVFNEKQIFLDHEQPFFQYEGNRQWEQDEKHLIRNGANDLTVKYRINEDDTPKQVTVTVPPGMYTTQELIDELEDSFEAAGIGRGKDGIEMEFTAHGFCNLNIQGGYAIDDVEGGLSYLLYDAFGGGSLGALIGTTVFGSDDAKLQIAAGMNDEMSFVIENTDGTTAEKSLRIDPGYYTRAQLIDKLNNLLSDTSVTAREYGTGIMLASEESIITEFKGNMFKIDHAEYESVYSSVFYDNVNYGNVAFTQGVFTGGLVLSQSASDDGFREFHITNQNNTLTFSPDNSGREATITLDAGTYSITGMVNKLNTLFAADDTLSGLRASAYEASDTNGKRYYGIKITSNTRGIESKVGLIKSRSTAYNTLFVNKGQTQITNTVNPVLAGYDITAYMEGKKAHNEALTIQAGVNDQFVLTLNNDPNQKYTITLAAGTYADADAVRDAINEQLNGAGADAAYRGRLTVSKQADNTIKFTGDTSINRVTVSGVEGNDGYKDLFVGVITEYYNKSATGNAAVNTGITLPIPTEADGTVNITEADRYLTIMLNNDKSVRVDLGTGVKTQQDIIDTINAAMANTKADIRFNPTGTYTGTTISPSLSRTNGVTNYSGIPAGPVKGVYEGPPQGMAGTVTRNDPAQMVFAKTVPESMKIDSTNNSFSCTINNKNVSFTIEDGTYTRAQLVQKLQEKFNANCSATAGNMGGVTVSLQENTNYLVLTAGLRDGGGEAHGDQTSISVNGAASTFLRDLYATTKSKAYLELTPSLKSGSYTGASDAKISFKLTTRESGTQDINITLNGNYANSTKLLEAINNQLNGKGITASVVSGKLRLTTTNGGDGYSISNYSITDSCAKMLCGESTPASLTIPLAVQNNSTTIESGKNQFKMTINGTTYTANLTAKTYTSRAALAQEIQTKLNAAAGSDVVTVTVDDQNRLKFTTVGKGAGYKLSASYDNGENSAMRAIFGQTDGAVTASFNNANQLVLKRNSAGTNESITVNSRWGGPFYKDSTDRSNYPYSNTDGRHDYSYIDGVDLNQIEGYNRLSRTVTINSENNRLTFWRSSASGGSFSSLSCTLNEGVYTYDELKTELQNKLDQATGRSVYEVSVTDSGVRIQTRNTGYENRMIDMGGGFYYKVICGNKSMMEESTPTNVDGKQFDIPAFVMGRKDVKSGTTNIREGINDVLSLQYSDGANNYKFTMKLDTGSYNGSQLVRMIQGKLNEQLVRNGLQAGTIEVGIGEVYDTGISGSNDKNALHFKLSDKVPLPREGKYVIDAIGGSAAFSVFYQTEGDIARAYITGGQDLSNGVTIEDGENDFSVKVDDTTYSITLDAGTYTASDLITALNQKFEAATPDKVPLRAKLVNGNLRLEHTKFGKRTIKELGGALKNKLFYKTSKDYEEKEPINIKMSGSIGDYIGIDRPVVNTLSLGINAICISREKNAAKALDRIKQASSEVSGVRSYYGAMQNRLEHGINGNMNAAENTTAAESAIRDADMAKEAMENAKHNILEQTVAAVLAQANQQAEGVLALLR